MTAGLFVAGVGAAISLSAVSPQPAALVPQKEALGAGPLVRVAAGRPAQIDSVTAVRGQLEVLWSLPTGTQSRHVGIAAHPTMAADGSFVTVVASADVDSTTTSYESAVLPDGTYYVHVLVYDPGCACRLWSSVVTAVVSATSPQTTTTVGTTTAPATTAATTTAATNVTTTTLAAPTTVANSTTTSTTTVSSNSHKPGANRNHAPTLTWSYLRLRTGVANATVATFHLTVCDDTNKGKIRIVVQEVGSRNGRSFARTASDELVREVNGCRGMLVRWHVAPPFLGHGPLVVVGRSLDSGGISSNTVRVRVR